MASEVARSMLGVSPLKEEQLSVVECACTGRDTVVIMGTGWGKSVCFELTAFMDEQGVNFRTTVVIVPLTSLIDDHVARLRNRGISAVGLHSNLEKPVSSSEVAESIMRGELRLLFITPELLDPWKDLLTKLVDEMRKDIP